jgi:hypothetical protein
MMVWCSVESWTFCQMSAAWLWNQLGNKVENETANSGSDSEGQAVFPRPRKPGPLLRNNQHCNHFYVRCGEGCTVSGVEGSGTLAFTSRRVHF